MPSLLSNTLTPEIEPNFEELEVDSANCQFDLDVLEELIEQFNNENEENQEARLTVDERCLSLTVLHRDDNRVCVYYATNSMAFYRDIDENYVLRLYCEKPSDLFSPYSDKDFHDKWNAVLEAFEPCKIVDETFER